MNVKRRGNAWAVVDGKTVVAVKPSKAEAETLLGSRREPRPKGTSRLARALRGTPSWTTILTDARGKPLERHWRIRSGIVVVDEPGRRGGRYGIHYVQRGHGLAGGNYLTPSGVRFSRLDEVRNFVQEMD